jgi:hypothetical protein
MTNNKSQKILEDSYSELLLEVVDYILSHDEQQKAWELYRPLEKAVNENMEALRTQPRLLAFYQESILKLKFICFANLDAKEAYGLIKDNFCLQFSIADYDLLTKLNGALVNIILVEDRNRFKDDLRKAILANDQKITPNYTVKTVKDWLKDYVSKMGLDNKDNLAKAQYLVALKGNKSISPKEYNNLITLFDFYDVLGIPSDTPAGLEEEVPVMVNGKLYIFRKGILEPVSEKKEIIEAMNLLSENTGGDTAHPTTSSQSISISRQTTIVSTPPPSELEELQEALKDYAPSSLEYKAISQEISRLKVLELKAAQQSNVRK